LQLKFEETKPNIGLIAGASVGGVLVVLAAIIIPIHILRNKALKQIEQPKLETANV
jgi:hypothetical protein